MKLPDRRTAEDDFFLGVLTIVLIVTFPVVVLLTGIGWCVRRGTRWLERITRSEENKTSGQEKNL